MRKLFLHFIKAAFIIAVFLGISINASSQGTATGYCTVLKQPCNGYDGVLVTTVTDGMTPPLTFQYEHYTGGGPGEMNIHENVNSLVDTMKNIQGCNYVYVRDANNNYLYIQNTGMVEPFKLDYPSITPAVCPSKTGSAKITIDSGQKPDSVYWYKNTNNVPIILVAKGDSVSLPVGKYLAIVMSKGCKIYILNSGHGQDSMSMLNITSNSKITAESSTMDANCTNGTAELKNVTGGVEPYTYKWQNGANTSKIENLTSGSYLVTITDAEGCSANQYIYVNQGTTISVNSTVKDATCLQNDGSIITFGSGGKPPYSYLYSNGMRTQNVCCLAGGTNISVIVTDANGCSGQGYSYINSTTPITVTYSTTPSSCTAPTGTSTLTIKGGTKPYTTEWNTYPVQTDTTVKNMNPGNVSFKVTDAVGCVQTGTVIIPPISVINAAIAIDHPVCPATKGSIYTSANGTNPPYSYLWNNGSTNSQLTNVQTGSYTCKITDNVGCSITKYADIISKSPVKFNLLSTPASCIYSNDGSIQAVAYDGTAPYTYSWSNGQTTQTATGLSKGYYYAYVTDANGCTSYRYTSLGYNPDNDYCYCKVTGKVYLDSNLNCQLDTNERGIEHIQIHAKGFGYTYTDANGDYTFLLPTGKYKISETIQTTYPLADCQTKSVDIDITAASGCTNKIDFANSVVPKHDISILTTNVTQSVRGFPYTQAVVVQNNGTQTENNIQLVYKTDGQLNYNSTIPSVYNNIDPINKPNIYEANAGFPALSPGESLELITNYLVPVNIPLATEVNFKDTTVHQAPYNNWLNDETPWNNLNNFRTTILGSFDPNFIEVLPQGEGSEGYIKNSDSVLTYTIHFQNTGSYYAENVVLIDTLDKNLDFTSIKPGYSDYKYTAELSETGILKFTFNNIHLPWQSINDLGSNGMVTFTIKLKPNLADYTKINGLASIYFDFNEPVLTNKVLNTILQNVDVKNINSVNNNSLIYPNPASDILYVKLTDNNLITITDITGRLLISNKMDNRTNKVDISSLTKGIYFINFVDSKGNSKSTKFVKQ